MNPLYRASEVEFVLAKAGAAACFVDAREPRREPLGHAGEAAAPVLDHVRLLVPFGDAPDAAGPGWEEWLTR